MTRAAGGMRRMPPWHAVAPPEGCGGCSSSPPLNVRWWLMRSCACAPPAAVAVADVPPLPGPGLGPMDPSSSMETRRTRWLKLRPDATMLPCARLGCTA